MIGFYPLGQSDIPTNSAVQCGYSPKIGNVVMHLWDGTLFDLQGGYDRTILDQLGPGGSGRLLGGGSEGGRLVRILLGIFTAKATSRNCTLGDLHPNLHIWAPTMCVPNTYGYVRLITDLRVSLMWGVTA